MKRKYYERNNEPMFEAGRDVGFEEGYRKAIDDAEKTIKEMKLDNVSSNGMNIIDAYETAIEIVKRGVKNDN